jgi:predicted RNA-binding protein
VDVFQSLPSNAVRLLDIMGKSKEISQDLKKKL